MHLLTSLKSSVSISRQGPAFKSRADCVRTDNGEGTDLSSSPSVPSAFKSLPQDLWDSLKPLLVLLQAHSCKRYIEWDVDTMTQEVWQVTSNNHPSQFFPVQRLLLIGNEVIVDAEELGTCKVNLVDQADRVEPSGVEISGQILSLDDGAMILTCTDLLLLKKLEKLCLLSIFEYYSVFKSVTGTILSSLGLTLQDIHVVLSSSFNYKDWCEVYLKDQGWVKLWCHIDKVGRKGSGDNRSGRCQIKFYKDKRQTSSKNLVCFISDCEYTQDMFFYKNCKQDDPDYSQMSLQGFVKNLDTIKIVGNVCYPQEGFTTKTRSGSSSTMSIFHWNESPSKLSSLPSSPTSSSSKLKVLSPSRARHQRKTSEVSVDSSHSQYKDLGNCINDTKGLLIRPVSHNGVHHLEAMIRMIIPMMDCARLYGRPSQFKSDKSDPESLMFGQPKLPTVDYFAEEELKLLLDPQLDIEKLLSTDSSAIAMHLFSKFLSERIKHNAHRDRQLTFTQLSHLIAQSSRLLAVSEKLEGSVSSSSTSIIL